MNIASSFIRLCTIMLACSVLGLAHARSDDSEQPIHISADKAELNDKTGISVYVGNVEMIQGTTILKGDRITVYTEDNEVLRMIAIGDLATYQETNDDGDIVYAESEEMIHNAKEKKIELFRRAKITELDNVIRSDYIKYLTALGLMDTGTQSDRVNITIMPQSKTFDDEQ
ncbi:MAG: lipopolysaccharide transport periplasmic protein LptA [Gammaproteobacteria bacterium TMED119]|nr:MAG: lipopolysaccharide transport periplasmic protein LptA [Gammaproteobacteria bacterium TMED119]RCL47265.1 MAG: lipopolysaccharide transport periplasmic protein LptA [Candidatus Thioglobus sp.]